MTALPQSSVKFPRKVHHVWTGGAGGWAWGTGIQGPSLSGLCRKEDAVRAGMMWEGPVPG